MAKWYGKIGFSRTVEVEPCIWEQEVTEKEYYGDIVSDRWKRQSADKVNDDINISMTLSILADPFACTECSNIIYAEYMGTKWKVYEVEPQFPRLLLTLGGVYNG